MKIIQNEAMPKSNGHYSQCIEHKGILYLSGQLPFNPEDRSLPEGIEAQTLQVLNNVQTILEAAGSKINQVLRVRLYIPDVKLWDQVNQVYSDFFGEHKPARVVIPSRELHFGCLIEVETTAYID
ncbi:MAG: RidA family protein [Bacteroidota bacterium]